MLDAIKILRDKTSAGVGACQKALKEANGDIDKAVEVLRKQGVSLASKKAGRAAKDGRIETYIHQGGKLGVMVEVNCETDFVAKNDGFKNFVKDLAMQIAATSPIYVSKDDVTPDAIAKEKEIIQAQIKDKPAAAVEKITEGKLNKFYEDACLMEQPFVKDSTKKVKDLVTDMVAKMGENIVIRRFDRFQVGEELK
jgi:elongation factor Ts